MNLDKFDKRYLLFAIQVIGTPIALWALFTQATWPLLLATCVMFFLFKCVGITVTYHRILAHRAGKWRNSLIEFICITLGFYGSLISPIGWAGIHTDHHKYADTDKDPINPEILGWKGWFMIFWINSGPENGDIRAMVRVRRSKIAAFYHDHYYKMILLPLLLLVVPKVFFFFFFIPLLMSLWSQQLTVYSHDANGPYEKMNWFYAVASMGEHYHKWHHDHPNDTSGEGWIHYITRALTYK